MFGYLHLGLPKEKLKILAVTSLLTASKADELDENIPFLEDLQAHSQKSANLAMISLKDELTKANFQELELKLLQSFDWKMIRFTPFDFLESLMVLGVVYETDIIQC